METAIAIIEAALIPVAVFLLNWQMRVREKYALTAASDFVLAIFAFDIAALGAQDVFKNAMHATIFRSEYPHIFVILLTVSLASWCFVFLPQEKKLTATATQLVMIQGQMNTRFFGTWIAAGVMLTAHIFVFLYR